MSKKIELIFENEEGRNVTLSLDNPIYPPVPADVEDVMDFIISENVIKSTGGVLTGKKGARIVDRTVEDIPLS